MHDRSEQVLQVNTFRQAIGRNHDALFCVFHAFHAVATLFGGVFASDRLNTCLGEMLAQLLGNIVRRSNIATEHHHLIALLEQAFQVADKCGELWIARFAG